MEGILGCDMMNTFSQGSLDVWNHGKKARGRLSKLTKIVSNLSNNTIPCAQSEMEMKKN